MKPCIIITRQGFATLAYRAFDEDGDQVSMTTYNYNQLVVTLRHKGYSPVPLNSRLGRTIQDKVNGEMPH